MLIQRGSIFLCLVATLWATTPAYGSLGSSAKKDHLIGSLGNGQTETIVPHLSNEEVTLDAVWDYVHESDKNGDIPKATPIAQRVRSSDIESIHRQRDRRTQDFGTDNEPDSETGEGSEAGTLTFHAAPKEINVDAKLSYDQKFMALMNSPCRPEKDGYFGSTYGHYPYSIKYGFQIETVPNARITQVIEAIDDYIADEVLTNVFPGMCGYRRNRDRRQLNSERGRAGGFHFGTTQELPHVKCDMTGVRNPIDFCAVFTGEIKVYGHDQKDATYEVLSYINHVLNMEDPGRMHVDLIRMKSLKSYEKVTPLMDEIRPGSEGDDMDHDGDSGDEGYFHGNGPLGVSRMLWAGFVLGVVFISLGLVWLVTDRRKRAKLMFADGMIGYSSNSRRYRRGRGAGSGPFGNYFRSKRGVGSSKHFSSRDDEMSFYGQEESIRHSPEAEETVDLGAGNMLLMTDGRPVEIDYDEHHSGTSSDDDGEDDNFNTRHASMLPIDRSEGLI